MAWGTGSWGGSPWGGGAVAGDFRVSLAWAVGPRLVRVRLTSAPQARDGAPGSAVNPLTWEVTNLQTGQRLPVMTATVVLPYEVELYLSESLPSANFTARVRTTALRSANGVLLTGVYEAEFNGILDRHLASTNARLSNRRLQSTDLLNLPTPDGNLVGGTLAISSGGDYANHSGPELVKKLVLRRLLTVPGEFFHLPDYGLGLRVKTPLRESSLLAFRKRVEDSVRKEPEVASARATVEVFPSRGVVLVTVRARIRPTGGEIVVAHQGAFQGG